MIEINDVIANKYHVLSLLGKGGMSKVYLAKDLRIQAWWAIKEVVKKNDVYENSLRMEADLILKLDHPALPRIVDIFENEQTICLVMDYIEGKPLSQMGKQSEATVYAYALQIAEALQYLHSQNPPIIYRDMKPENVMVKSDGTIKIIDFGTARIYKEHKRKDTVVLGTSGYAPWEQYIHQSDARSDIYALGMTMYFMLTQNHPHTLDRRQSFASAELQAIVCKCVEMEPLDRFQTCDELIQTLKNPQKLKWNRQKIWKISTVICFCLALFGFFTDAFLHHRQYDVLISTSTATSYEERIQKYTKAIQLYPYRPQAYEKLLSTFEEDGIFSKEESDLFLNVYNINHSGLRSPTLNYQAGRMYFNYDLDPLSLRIMKAYSFFEENHTITKMYPEKELSESYYEICVFYKKYIFQSISVDEASQKEYEQLLSQIKRRQKQIKKESVYDQLTYHKAVLSFIYDQRETMKQVNISQAQIQQVIDQIQFQVSSLKPYKPASLRLQKEILELGGMSHDTMEN